MLQTSIEIYNTVTDVQVIEVTAGGLTTTADLNAAVTAASGSATAAAASAASAISSKDLAESSAQSALESETSAASSAADALTSSQTATTAASEAESSAISALESANAASASETSAASSATTATTQANIATSAASAALTSEQSAANSEQVAITQATTATEQATIATTRANTATTQAGIATTAASSASVSASTATTQANVATTAASEAEASAVSALDSSTAAAASEIAAASSASSAASSASTATAQAGIATTASNNAETARANAVAAATSASASASTATTQAGIATTAATSASASASQAASSAAQASAVALQQSFGRKFVPTISLDATSRTVPSYLPCTRAGVATFFDQSGVLRTANANEGRIDFDPVTGECLGLLSEGVGVQYLRNPISNVFATYNLNFGTLTERITNFGLAPNGQTTTRLTSTTGTIHLRDFTGISIPPGNYRMVVYSSINTSGISASGVNGTVIGTLGRFFIIQSNLITYTTTQTFFDFYITGAVTGIELWGLQLIPDGQVGSIIPTNTTRPADLFATTGFQFQRRYNQREGTFYINTRAISNLTTTVAVFSDGTTNNETRLLANGTLTIRKGGVQIATIQATGATLTAHSIFGFTYKGTRVVITRNGATVGVVTASEELATNYTTFQLGTGIYVRNLRYVPRAFSDSELQFVTNPLYFVGLEGDKVPTINDLSSGAFMEVQDLQTLRTRSEITIFGSGALRSIVINRPYPFLIEQVYVSPTGVTTATLPTLPTTGFYAANTDYTVLFNATADRTLVLAIIPQTIN